MLITLRKTLAFTIHTQREKEKLDKLDRYLYILIDHGDK